MKFSIRHINGTQAGNNLCEIIVGDLTERFPLVTSLWSPTEYENQWREALGALIDRKVDKCVLITDIQPSKNSFGISCWAIFRELETAYFQERIIRENSALLAASPLYACDAIAPRLQGTVEEQARVSEWAIPIESIVQFLQRAS